jgi:hypothetical protein
MEPSRRKKASMPFRILGGAISALALLVSCALVYYLPYSHRDGAFAYCLCVVIIVACCIVLRAAITGKM